MKSCLRMAVLTGCLFSLPGYVNANMTGSGTLQDSYQISNCTDLQNMQQNLSASYVLANDIDCTDTKNWNNGAGFNPINTFTGSFDGQNHIISNLYINRPNDAGIGLFGWTANAAISNVGLVNVNITGEAHVGGLIGAMDFSGGKGMIKNCYVTGAIQGINSTSVIYGNIGGLVGTSGQGTVIIDSYVEGIVTTNGEENVGGLIGMNDGNLENVHFSGQVKATAKGEENNIGGLIGSSYGFDNPIINAYSTGSVTGINAPDVGGLIGNSGAEDIVDSYSTATVEGLTEVGGLVGSFNSGMISGSYATGAVTANGIFAGGLVGFLVPGSVLNSYATVAVSGNATVGGLVGMADGTITNSYSVGHVMDNEGDAGGLVGETSPGSVSDSYYDVDTSGQSDTGKGDPKSDAQMKQAETFLNWDFVKIWQIDENVGYPLLRR